MSTRPMTHWEAKIAKLLSDGVARTPREIMLAISGIDSSFTEQQQASRQVMPSLYALRERSVVLRMVYYVATQYPGGKHVPVDRYVDKSTVAPVCIPCWHQHWPHLAAEGGPPPQVPGYPPEYCSLCRRLTKDGSYMPLVEIEERRVAAVS